MTRFAIPPKIARSLRRCCSGSLPLASGLPRRPCFFYAGTTCVTAAGRAHWQAHGASETGDRLSVMPESTEENQGPPRCLVCPLTACRGRRPRRMRLLLALLRNSRRRLRVKQRARHPECVSFRGCIPHGPLARVTTHRRPRYRTRRKSRFQLDGLGPWLGGFRARWTSL